MKTLSGYICAVALFSAAIGAATHGRAQEITVADLPNAPAAIMAPAAVPDGASAAATASPGSSQDTATTHLSFWPKFGSLSASDHPPAQSVGEKFLYATEDNIDVFSIGVPAMSAGFKQLTKATPEFGKGPPAYGRYYWHSWVDRASEDYCVEFILPAITREDSRYYSLGRAGGSGWRRAGYAVTRVLVTRTDSQKETFNASEVIGAGVAAGLTNLYYPHGERSFSDVGQRWGLDIGFDAAAFVLREFWPDLNHWLFHGQ